MGCNVISIIKGQLASLRKDQTNQEAKIRVEQDTLQQVLGAIRVAESLLERYEKESFDAAAAVNKAAAEATKLLGAKGPVKHRVTDFAGRPVGVEIQIDPETPLCMQTCDEVEFEKQSAEMLDSIVGLAD